MSKFAKLLILGCVLLILVTPGFAVDSRFGVDGWSPDVDWWRVYNADYNNINIPDPVKKNGAVLNNEYRMWTVGKIDGNEENIAAYGGSDAMYLPWALSFSQQKANYLKILDLEKPGIKKIIDDCKKNHNGKAIHFAIGNEPNAFPYIDPSVYAQVFKAYSDYIKKDLGCTECVIHNGGIIAVDIWKVRDNYAAIENWYYEYWWRLKNVYLKGYEYLTGGDPDMYGVLGDNVRMANYANYTRLFLNKLNQLGGAVDVFNVHLYHYALGNNGVSGASATAGLLFLTYNWDIAPIDLKWSVHPKSNYLTFLAAVRGKGVTANQIIDVCGPDGYPSFTYTCDPTGTGIYSLAGASRACKDKTPINLDNGKHCTPGETFSLVDGMLKSKDAKVSNLSYMYENPEIWVDEFGEAGLQVSRSDVANLMVDMVGFMSQQPNIRKWFWYKDVGSDDKGGDLFSSKINLYTDYSYANKTSLGETYVNLSNTTANPTPRSLGGANVRLPGVAWGALLPKILEIDNSKSRYALDIRKGDVAYYTNDAGVGAAGVGVADNGVALKWLYTSPDDHTPEPIPSLKILIPKGCNGKAACPEIQDAKFMTLENQEIVGGDFKTDRILFELKNRVSGVVRYSNFIPGFTFSLTQGYVAGASSDGRFTADLRKIKQSDEDIVSVRIEFEPEICVCTVPLMPKGTVFDYETYFGRLVFSDSDQSLLYNCLPMKDDAITIYAGRQNVALDFSSSIARNHLGIVSSSVSGGQSWDDNQNKLFWTPSKSQIGIQRVAIGKSGHARTYTFNVVEPLPTAIQANTSTTGAMLTLNAGIGAQTYSVKINGSNVTSGNFAGDGTTAITLEKSQLNRCSNTVVVTTCDPNWGCRDDSQVLKNPSICILPALNLLMD